MAKDTRSISRSNSEEGKDKAEDKKYIRCGKSDMNVHCNMGFAIGMLVVALVLAVIVPTCGNLLVARFRASDVRIINSADTFIAALQDSSKKAQVGKDYYFDENTDEIILTKEHLDKIASMSNYTGEGGVWFCGHLNGNGRTIRIQYGAKDKKPFTISAPILEQICEGATIERLNIVVDENAVFASSSNELAVLAKTNYGTVKDVSLTATIEITATNTAVGGLCVYNFGSIKSCKLGVDYITNENYWTGGDKLESNTWTCYVGAIAAHNMVSNGQSNNTVSYVYIESNFKNKGVGSLFAVLSLSQYNKKGDKNTTIGYAFGYNSPNVKVDNVVVLSDKLYVTDLEQIEFSTISETYSEENWRNWYFDGSNLELKKSERG